MTLTDALGSADYDVQKLPALGLPADKNGEDPTAPTDPDHLAVYTIKQTTPRFVTRSAFNDASVMPAL